MPYDGTGHSRSFSEFKVLEESLVKAELSFSYVHAVATSVSFSCQKVSIDRDSVDITIRAKGKLVDNPETFSPLLDVQLKSEVSPETEEDYVLHDLKVKNYKELRGSGYDVNRILVLFALPSSREDWIDCGPEELVARRCCYWYSLRRLPEVDNQHTKRINIPKEQRFTPESLTMLMETIARGEEVDNVTD